MSTPDYPVGTHVQILDVTGLDMVLGDEPVPIQTPEISKPHVGKFGEIVGYAQVVGDDDQPMTYMDEGEIKEFLIPVIRLEDGTELLGAECWWQPLDNTTAPDIS